jgi:hypothetical protein
MADTGTRNRRLMLMRQRLPTDTPLPPHTDMRGHRHTPMRRRRELAPTTRITSGTTVIGGFRTIMRGFSNIIQTGSHRESRDRITSITNAHFHG